jgi:hypothetical protein
MAVELTKVALWIETVDPGKPLGFMDANIRCGDALLGVFDMKALAAGIPDAAYKPLTGDDRATTRYYAACNRDDLQGQEGFDFARDGSRPPAAPLAKVWASLRALPEDNADQIWEKRRRFEAARAQPLSHACGEAADLYIAAFLMPKRGDELKLGAAPLVPTSGDVWRALADKQVHPSLVVRAVDASRAARAFHWPLEFPEAMAAGGFDVVLGNPPWERIKLQEQEFFAARDPEIAAAPNAAARGRLIAALAKAALGTPERVLHEAFEAAKRLAEAASVFAREAGRFPLTGRGDVNTYALFAEHFANLTGARGRAGMIVPTGIATDANTALFFAALIDGKRLARLIDFENRAGIFPAIDSRMKFSLLTIGRDIDEARFAFFLTVVGQLAEPERGFALSPVDIGRINPNTRTAPVFRSRADAELTARIYGRVPVLIEEAKGRAGNPWGVSFARLFDMSNDSGLFRTAAQLRETGFTRDGTDWVGDTARYVPLYEAKMADFFDHRSASYDDRGDTRGYRVLPQTPAERHMNSSFEPLPFYWVPSSEVDQRLANLHWGRSWLFGFKDITSPTNERTFICSLLPGWGVGNNMPLLLPNSPPKSCAALFGNLSSLCFDFVVRQKIGGLHLNYFYINQFPVLPPSSYTEEDTGVIVSRILQLTYNSHAMAPLARDLGYDGPPFEWNENCRAVLRAELDAFYARAYGVTRDELRYILDPEDAMGPGYPSETFRVLKQNEIRRFGEYRTARLVLAAWDAAEQAKRAKRGIA